MRAATCGYCARPARWLVVWATGGAGGHHAACREHAGRAESELAHRLPAGARWARVVGSGPLRAPVGLAAAVDELARLRSEGPRPPQEVPGVR